MHETLLVADSSPLIVLAKIGRLNLLRGLVARVVVPQAVWEEIAMRKPEALDSRELMSATWLEVRSVEVPDDSDCAVELDAGEAEAIELAATLPGCRLLIDERLGRRVAAARRIPVVGTLGLLVEAKERHLISSVRSEVDRLRSAGYFLSDQLIEAAIRRAGEA